MNPSTSAATPQERPQRKFPWRFLLGGFLVVTAVALVADAWMRELGIALTNVGGCSECESSGFGDYLGPNDLCPGENDAQRREREQREAECWRAHENARLVGLSAAAVERAVGIALGVTTVAWFLRGVWRRRMRS